MKGGRVTEHEARMAYVDDVDAVIASRDGCTLAELWTRRVTERPHDLFLIERDRAWTAVEVDGLVAEMRSRLRQVGVERGDAVAVQGPNDAVRIAMHFALQLEQAITVPLLEGLTPSECHDIVLHAGPRWIITTSGASATGSGDPRFEDDDMVMLAGPEVAHDVRAATATAAAAGAGWIIYTSGSTGRPKGVVLPRTSFGACGAAYARTFGIRAGDRLLLCFPLAHAIGTHTMPGIALASGATIGAVRRFSVSRFWDDVRDVGATATVLFPSQMTLLADAAASTETATASGEFRLVITHQLHEGFQRAFPEVAIATVWGMTETGAVGTGMVGAVEGDDPHAAGPVMPGGSKVAVLGSGDVPLPEGEVGEIAFRNEASQMLGYFRDPELTATTLAGGWVHSGDLGVLGPNGLSFRGRSKNIIKRAGETIVGDEIEDVLDKHDQVHECAVAAVPDRELTEEVGVVVFSDSDPEALRTWLRDRLAPWKLPRYWVMLDHPLPRLENHKLSRRGVADLLAQESGRFDLEDRR